MSYDSEFGDFGSADPLERYNAHQRAKGRATLGDPDLERKRQREQGGPSYELGQAFERRDQPGRVFIVCDVRPAGHERGMEYDSALALPWDDYQHPSWRDLTPEGRARLATEAAHPFDVVILCRDLPSHGDEKWQRVG